MLDQWGGAGYLWHLMLDAAGVRGGQRGQPRDAVAPGAGVPESDLQEDRPGQLRRSGRRGADDARVAMGGLDSHRRVGLERRRVHHAQRDVPLPRAVPDRHVRRAGPRPAAVRHDLHERYMGLPQENEQVYHDGSPVFFADRLRGNLLLVHGSGDDNVHYQGTERLVNALVSANRPFTMMVYPNRTHCICEGDGTGLHLFSLLTRYLEQNLPAGAR